MELLRQLNKSFSVCGYEDEIQEVVRNYFSQKYDVRVDQLGNVIAHKGGRGAHYVFLAPMDVPGAFLNVKKEGDSYFYTKLTPSFKTTNGSSGRSREGIEGVFCVDEKKPELSHFKTDGLVIKLPTVAEVTVPFSFENNFVKSRHCALYSILKLSEKLCEEKTTVTFIALAQTSLRNRGAFGAIPQGADCYFVIEPYENEHFKVGNGSILCLKDGEYIMPLVLKERLKHRFENLLVCEDKQSLSGCLAKRKGGCMVASVKLPVADLRTDKEQFSFKDVDDLISRIGDIVKKG